MESFRALKSIFSRLGKSSISDDAPRISDIKKSAEKFRKDYELDYSPESLRELDVLIQEWEEDRFEDAEIVDTSSSEDIEKTGDDIEFTSFVHGFSSYFGETLRRNLNGEWVHRSLEEIRKAKNIGNQDTERVVATVSIPTEEGEKLPSIIDITKSCINGNDSFYDNYNLISDNK